jgi:hypothetical protein
MQNMERFNENDSFVLMLLYASKIKTPDQSDVFIWTYKIKNISVLFFIIH